MKRKKTKKRDIARRRAESTAREGSGAQLCFFQTDRGDFVAFGGAARAGGVEDDVHGPPEHEMGEQLPARKRVLPHQVCDHANA